jgi:sugar lactone lactonase YvrE
MKLFFALAAIALSTMAQPQGKQPPPPPLAACGATQGTAEIVCGARSPEDLEPTPDGKFLIATAFVNGRNAPGTGLMLFDVAKKTFAKMSATSEPLKDWGDAKCPGPIGDALISHGISVSKRSGGKEQIYVVNHGGGRQSIEMYELKAMDGSWSLIWHGCVTAEKEYNDVAAMPDGGFFATHPTAIQQQGADLFGGAASGFVVHWSAAKGEEELPGTRTGYPNGILASSDGRFVYFNAWTLKEVHKYDVRQGKEVGMVKLDFMPDNINWTKNGKMLAAGVKSARGMCPAASTTPCIQTFGVAEIEPKTMASKKVFDSEGQNPQLISGVSDAQQLGNFMYIGAFQGDRLVKIPFKE